MKYVNTDRNTSQATFSRVSPSVDGSHVTVKVNNAFPKIGGTTVAMVRGVVRLTVPTEVVACGDTCGVSVNEAVALEFNLRPNGANLAALRTELLRVFDMAVADHLLSGIVPPTHQTFSDE